MGIWLSLETLELWVFEGQLHVVWWLGQGSWLVSLQSDILPYSVLIQFFKCMRKLLSGFWISVEDLWLRYLCRQRIECIVPFWWPHQVILGWGLKMLKGIYWGLLPIYDMQRFDLRNWKLASQLIVVWSFASNGTLVIGPAFKKNSLADHLLSGVS